MIAEFQARADIHGQRINLEWSWVTPATERPVFRLLRRCRSYPTAPEDGLCVLDTSELSGDSGQTTARVERRLFLGRGMAVESNLRLAEVVYLFNAADAAPDRPFRVTVSLFAPDPAYPERQVWQTVPVQHVTHLDVIEKEATPWAKIETCAIYATSDSDDLELAGTLVISSGHQDGTTPDQLAWHAPDLPGVSLAFDRQVAQATTIRLRETRDPNSGDRTYHLGVADLDLEPEQVYYYALFVKPDPAKTMFEHRRDWRAMALATGHYSLDARLYQLLPALHRQYDEPLPDQPDTGQLQRFLQIFGTSLDHLRSRAESLRLRHDLREVAANRLPALAHWIGWELNRTLEPISQRNQIRFAPDIYRGVGTLPNIKALVNLVTGWDCRVKEFAHNVVRSNAPEAVHLWELWERRYDGTEWSNSAALEESLPDPDSFAGRPATVTDSAGRLWLVWHANHTGRWQIWGRISSDNSWSKPVVLTPEPGMHQEPAIITDGGGVRLYWATNTTGTWQICSRTCSLTSAGKIEYSAVEQLTSHPAEERFPAVVQDGQGQPWLFWQSNRRGPTDIWARKYNGTEWQPPERITTAAYRHETPAAVRVTRNGAAEIWLFYVVSDQGGSRRDLAYQIFSNGKWHDPHMLNTGADRIESPAAIVRDNKIWLFWHANRDEYWNIWYMTHDGTTWNTPVAITDHCMADKEPGVGVDAGGTLRVFWRSQRRGSMYQSHSFDRQDVTLMGTFEDRMYYTYDRGNGNDDWYTQGTVGIYLTPDTEDRTLIERNQALISSALQPFLPAHVRVVFIIEPAVYREQVYTYDFPKSDPPRRIGEKLADQLDQCIPERYPGVAAAYQDTLPGWIWFRSWSATAPVCHTIAFQPPPADPPTLLNLECRTWHRGVELEQTELWNT